MDRKYQIFISSTFSDLEEERRKVTEQILNLGHIPVGMELFQAGDETQWSYIKRRISDCDYYIVIIAERYGSIGSGGKSYTEMEYEYASKIKIPTVGFLLHSDARRNWPLSKVDTDLRKEVDRFRAKCQKKLVKYWSNSDDLCAKVSTSIVEIIREKPRVGWIRGDQGASNLAIEELSKLSGEKRVLQDEVEQLKISSKSNTEKMTSTIINLSSLRLTDYIGESRINDDVREALTEINLMALLH